VGSIPGGDTFTIFLIFTCVLLYAPPRYAICTPRALGPDHYLHPLTLAICALFYLFLSFTIYLFHILFNVI
jgi:hypothetical protein